MIDTKIDIYKVGVRTFFAILTVQHLKQGTIFYNLFARCSLQFMTGIWAAQKCHLLDTKLAQADMQIFCPYKYATKQLGQLREASHFGPLDQGQPFKLIFVTFT